MQAGGNRGNIRIRWVSEPKRIDFFGLCQEYGAAGTAGRLRDPISGGTGLHGRYNYRANTQATISRILGSRLAVFSV